MPVKSAVSDAAPTQWLDETYELGLLDHGRKD